MQLDVNVDHRLALVTLSRRNLETLLAKLDGFPTDSVASLTLNLGHAGEGEWALIVHAQEDRDHYPRLGREPGPMHPETEARLSA